MRGERDDRLAHQPAAGQAAKSLVAVTLLALLLVAAVPACLAGVVMMLLGHVVAGLALSGGSVLAATIAVAIAGISGLRRLRKLVSGSGFRFMQFDDSQHANVADPLSSDDPNVIQLDRSEYTEVHR